MHLIDEKYRREKERMTLNKRLDHRKNMLQARQKWMDEAFSNGYKILIDQPLSEYKKLLISLIENVSQSRDEEVIFGSKGTKKFHDEVIKEINAKKGMKFSIDESILNATLKCKDSFACINGGKDCFCEAEQMVSDKVLFVKPNKNIACSYMKYFGDSLYCTCPTRMEIYRKYNKEQ